MKCGNKRCQAEAAIGRKRCAKCAKQQCESKARRREMCREAGICYSCSLPVVPGKRRCATCLEVASNAAMVSHGRKRRRSYRAHQNSGIDEYDIAYVPLLTEHDHKLASLGRCKCGLLLPCATCLPTNVVDFVAYLGTGGHE